MEAITLRRYETLSPFEVKDELIKIARRTTSKSNLAFLNAGRGNPNWVATKPREAFFLLGQFAIEESKRVWNLPSGVGGMPQAPGIAARLDAAVTQGHLAPGDNEVRAWALMGMNVFLGLRYAVWDDSRPVSEITAAVEALLREGIAAR